MLQSEHYNIKIYPPTTENISNNNYNKNNDKLIRVVT